MPQEELEGWASTCTEGVWQAPENAAMVLGYDDGLEMVMLTFTQEEAERAFDMLLVHSGPLRHRRVLCAGVRAAWTNDPEPAPTELAWMVIVVARDLPAWFLVRRVEREDKWWVLANDDVPWAYLTTASSLRGMLDGEDPPPVKTARDRRLFNVPGKGAVPPVDEQGRL